MLGAVAFELLVQGVLVTQRLNACDHGFLVGLKVGSAELHDGSDLYHILLDEAAGGGGGSTDADTAGYEGRLRIVGDGVLVAGGGFGIWTALAFALDAFCLWAIFRPGKKVEC